MSRSAAEGLLLFAVAFGPLAFGCVEPWSLSLLEAALFALPVFYLFGDVRWTKTPIDRLFIPGVLVVTVLAVLRRLNPASVLEPQSILPFTAAASRTTDFLILWTGYLALLWCAPRVLASPDSRRRFTWAVFVLGLFIGVMGVVQRGQGNTAIYGLRLVGPDRNPFGPYYNSGHAASMISMSLFMGCGIFLARFDGKRRVRRPGAVADLVASQCLVLFLIGVLLYSLMATKSRGAIHAAVASTGLAVFLAGRFLGSRRAVWALRGALVASVAGYMAFLCLRPQWLGLVKGILDESASYRLSMYRSGLRMIADFPAFGVGQGAFIAAFPAYQDRKLFGLVTHIHSDWLELAVESGILGLAVYAGGLALFLRCVCRAWMETRSWEDRCLMGGGVAASLAFILHGLADFSFQIPANAVIFFSILSCLSASAQGYGQPAARAEAPGFPFRPGIVRAAALAVCLFLIAGAARPALAEWYTRRGRGSTGSLQGDFFSRAASLDPRPIRSYRVASAYLSLAVAEPKSRESLLRGALRHSGACLRDEPANSKFNFLEGTILWRLGRANDGQRLLAQASLNQ